MVFKPTTVEQLNTQVQNALATPPLYPEGQPDTWDISSITDWYSTNPLPFTLEDLKDIGMTPTQLKAVWNQLGDDLGGEAAGDRSGISVSLNSDGTIMAIGADLNDGNGNASGHVRVYKYSGGTWNKMGQDINGEGGYDYSGRSVSLSSDGSIVAIGAYRNDGSNGSDSGHVRVYKYDGSAWNKMGGDIDGEASGDNSGYSVSLSSDGSIVAIGAFYNDGNGSNSGHVRVYQYTDGSWTKMGDDIDGEAAGDQSGISVSLSSDGSIVAIGARYNGGNGSGSGHVRVYKYDGSAWNQMGGDIDGEAAIDNSGISVSLSSDGTIVAIGAYGNSANGSYSGHVRVYQYNGSAWSQLGDDIDGEATFDYSGYSVSLSSDGSIVAIGAPYNDANGNVSGHVRVYQYTDGSWNQLGTDIDGEAAGDQSGISVSLSSDGSIVAIGAMYNDGSNGSDSGHVRVYQYGYSSAELKAGGFTAAELKAADFDATALKAGGFNLSELINASFPFTQILEAGYSISVTQLETAPLKTLGYTATDLATVGFNASQLKTLDYSSEQLNASIFDVAQLIAAGYTLTNLIDNGILLSDLVKSFTLDQLKDKFTLAELKAAFTLAELKAKFTLADLKAEFKLTDLKAAGFTLDELKAVGFILAELKVVGFILDELKDKFTLAELKAAFTLVELKDKFTLAELKAEFKLTDLKTAGFTLDELKAVGFILAELKVVGFILDELKDKFTLAELKTAFTLAELKAEFTLAELKAEFKLTDLKAVGFILDELKAVGFILAELKAAGFILDELKDKFTLAELKAAFTLAELKDKFILTDLKDGGINAAELHKVGYSFDQLRLAGFSAVDCRNGGMSNSELPISGFSIKQLRIGGLSATRMKNAGYSAKQLYENGYPVPHLFRADYSASEIRLAGVSALQARFGGISNKEMKTAGYTVKEYKAASYKASRMKEAGYTREELTGIYNEGELDAAGF